MKQVDQKMYKTVLESTCRSKRNKDAPAHYSLMTYLVSRIRIKKLTSTYIRQKNYNSNT